METLADARELNVQRTSEEMLEMMGGGLVRTEVLDVTVEPSVRFSQQPELTSGSNSNQCQNSSQSQQSYSSMSSQQSSRCSHGCHPPR